MALRAGKLSGASQKRPPGLQGRDSQLFLYKSLHALFVRLLQGYIKGYISHQHQKLVVSKQNPFPALTTFLQSLGIQFRRVGVTLWFQLELLVMITSGVHGSIEEEMARLADSASGTALVGLQAIRCNTSTLAYEDENFVVGCTLAVCQGQRLC